MKNKKTKTQNRFKVSAKIKAKMWEIVPIAVGIGILIYAIFVRISHHN